jgi:CelD/BcsL family acetyltransferase involved in cellulose biosynthesis
VAAWYAIQEDHPEYANPFLGPGFTQAVAAVKPKVGVAVVMEDREPVAFFPFEHGPLGIGRAVGLGVSDCQGVVQRPGVVTEAEPLLQACGLSVWQFDSLMDGRGTALLHPHAYPPRLAGDGRG